MRSETRALGVGEIREAGVATSVRFEKRQPQPAGEMNRSRVLLSPLNYQFI